VKLKWKCKWAPTSPDSPYCTVLAELTFLGKVLLLVGGMAAVAPGGSLAVGNYDPGNERL